MTGREGIGWNASRHLELSGDYAVNRIRFRERNEALTTHLVRARLRTAASTRASGSAFLQYNSVTDAISAKLRSRYHVRDGNDLYLVYIHALDSERLRGGLAGARYRRTGLPREVHLHAEPMRAREVSPR